MKTIGESIGIEIEFNGVYRKGREFVRMIKEINPDIRIVHDASCETPVYQIRPRNLEKTVVVVPGNVLPQLGSVNEIGGEIVTHILHSKQDDWKKMVYQVVEVLRNFQDSSEDNRDSFHVHVNVSDQVSLTFLQNLLRAIMHFEPVLYKLGGMGRENRGEYNEFIFQRPYTYEYGPPIDGSNRPTFVVDDLLKCVTKREFWEKFNFSQINKGAGIRYVTSRYMVVNLWSILNIGTVEFRSANKVLNAEYLIAWVEFCIAFVNWVFYTKGDLVLPPQSVYDFPDLSIEKFDEMLSVLELGETTTSILKHIWRITPNVNINRGYVYSHLDENTWGGVNTRYKPKQLLLQEIRRPNGYVHVRDLRRGMDRQFVKEFINKRGELNGVIREKMYDFAVKFREEQKRERFKIHFPMDDGERIIMSKLGGLSRKLMPFVFKMPNLFGEVIKVYFAEERLTILFTRTGFARWETYFVVGKQVTYKFLQDENLISKTAQGYKLNNYERYTRWFSEKRGIKASMHIFIENGLTITVPEILDQFRKKEK